MKTCLDCKLKISIRAIRCKSCAGKKRKHTEESKKKMSEKRNGIVFSDEHLKNLRKHLKSIIRKEDKASSWKGDSAGYHAIHKWIQKHEGKPEYCSCCGTKTAKRYEWANISGKYKRDVNDFIRLCKSCHELFDKKFNKDINKTRRHKAQGQLF